MSEYIIATMQLMRIVQWQSSGDLGTIRREPQVAQRIELAVSKGGGRMPYSHYEDEHGKTRRHAMPFCNCKF